MGETDEQRIDRQAMAIDKAHDEGMERKLLKGGGALKLAVFKLDDNDSGLPGLAEVEIIKPVGLIMGREMWKIRILKIIRPSLLGSQYKVGQIRRVSAQFLKELE